MSLAFVSPSSMERLCCGSSYYSCMCLVRGCGWSVGGPVVCVTVAPSVCLQCVAGVDGRARDDDGDALGLGRVWLCGCVVLRIGVTAVGESVIFYASLPFGPWAGAP